MYYSTHNVLNRKPLAGVTLVELLVYMTILSLVTIGITQMVTEIQKANVQTVNLADQFADADLALRRVQIKLGDSDKVEVADLGATGDRACLRLKNFEQYERNAVYFDGHNQYLRGANHGANEIQIENAMPRTVSVWVRVDADLAGRSTVVTWGNGPQREFGIEISDGRPELQMNCMSLYPAPQTVIRMGVARNEEVDLRDGGWHHLAVTYLDPGTGAVDANSAKIFVDGKQLPTVFQRCGTSLIQPISTRKTTLFIGRHPLVRQSGFRGLISDIRIWQRALSGGEIAAIANRAPSADTNVNNLHVRLSLDNVTGSGIANSGSWQGASTLQAYNMGTPATVRRTLVDQTDYHSFCMVDEDGDGLHALWESETANDLPQRTGGSYQASLARDWISRSEDMFVPSAAGFFKVVGENPETVIANFAVGKGIADQQNLREKAQSKPLASTRITRHLELCAINASIDRPVDNMTAAQISSTLCSFDKAFIEIKDYIPGQHGRLHIKHVNWTGAGDIQTATNLPNMPTRVTATWYRKLGILKFNSDINLDTKVWARIMANTLYLPTGRASDATVTFNFGVGGLPFFKDGEYRMYDFAERNTKPTPGAKADSLDFDTAMQEARTYNTLFCGMRSHLATITSEDEQLHLEKVMKISSHAGWKSGWIGARVDAGGIFKWIDGAEDGQEFWIDNGISGFPYDELRGAFAYDGDGRPIDRFEIDRLPSFTGNHRQMKILPGIHDRRFRYTNWGGGKEREPWFPDTYSCDGLSSSRDASKCEPVSIGSQTAVAIHGHRRRGGGWFTNPETTRHCDEAAQHSVCGYYREFDHVGKEADARIGAQVTLKMNRFREFCLTPDNATP